MDVVDGATVPKSLLGYKIKTRTQIVFTFLIPTSLELIAYLTQTMADTAVTIQHFRNNQPFYACLTLTFICLPSSVCFISIMTSPWQWPKEKGCSTKNSKFFLKQLFSLILFPIGALHRFCRRIFWSVEALFYEKDTFEREHSMSKAAETSSFELYHFVQAYTQASPQIILQLYILLREDIFRNYETTNVQVLSVIFSLINVAAITVSYQRFESQKIVGRYYPWSSESQIQNQQRKFHRTRSNIQELREKKKNPIRSMNKFPENNPILERFHSKLMTVAFHEIGTVNPNPTVTKTESVTSEIEQEHVKYCESTKGTKEEEMKHFTNSIIVNITDDEKLNSYQERSHLMDEMDTGENINAIVLEEISLGSELPSAGVEHETEDVVFDTVPDNEAPSPPKSQEAGSSINKRTRITTAATKKSQNSDLANVNTWQKYFNNPMKRFCAIKNKVIMNAELYITDHVPHPPHALLQRTGQVKETAESTCAKDEYKNDISDINCNQTNLPITHKGMLETAKDFNMVDDTTDFFLPTRRKMIKGVEQDDFIAKFVSFFGWVTFIFMRMISLSMFSLFYLEEFLYILIGHYVLMLICLIYESRRKEKIERILFYVFLAYVYVFVILEFRIKFKHLRLWYFGYFALVMTQNFLLTILWYTTKEFDSWSFGFLFDAIIVSGLLCLSCMLVYYCILKPNKVILLEKE